MSHKDRVYEIVSLGSSSRLGRVVDSVVVSLIVVSVVGVIVGTMEPYGTRFRPLLLSAEVVTVSVFTVEYLLRLWSCTADERYAAPVTGRLRYALQPRLLIDLLAVVPFFLGPLLFDLRFLRALRLFRFFRLLKLAQYSTTVQQFGRVLRERREDFVLTASASGILLVVAASLMYFLEHEAQPEAFGSIPAAMWWATVTLTTVGYGGVTPETPAGRVFAAIVAALGVGLFALPASILASGFMKDEESDPDYCPHCGEKL